MICTQPSFDTVARYNELPSLWDVYEAKNKQVTEDTFNTLGQIFAAHHVESIFGLALLHNHFSLEEGEILLETGSLFNDQKVISQPVKIDELVSPVQGSNWRITPEQSYVPYEFRPEDEDEKIDFSSSEIQSFLEKFLRKLNELNLTNIFGICAIDKDSFLPGIESTEGRKNITVPLIIDSVKPENQIEAVWKFNSSGSVTTPCYCIRSCLYDYCRRCHTGCSCHY